jgi:adenylyltransferase/sulfurtransferase
LIASLQATEAIKWISGNRKQVRSSVLSVDLWENRIREIRIPESLSKDCRACGSQEFDFLDGRLGGTDDGTTILCGRGAVQIASVPSQTGKREEDNKRLDLAAIAQQWQSLGQVHRTAFFIRVELVNEDADRLTLFRDGRVIVDGTEDPSIARVIRDRYLG